MLFEKGSGKIVMNARGYPMLFESFLKKINS